MKLLLRATLFAFLLCNLPVLRAADTKAKSPPATTTRSVAGDFNGEWKSTGDSTGKLRITLKQAAATWTAEAVFTFESVDVSTQMKTVEVDAAKVVLVFDWQIQGTLGQSRLTGELKGEILEGTFESKSPEGQSKGTWKVTRK